MGARGPSHVDCFASVARCDVADAITGRKLVGSAQRREHGAILQQMSLHLTGLKEVAEFVRILQECMFDALCVDAWEFVDTD